MTGEATEDGETVALAAVASVAVGEGVVVAEGVAEGVVATRCGG